MCVVSRGAAFLQPSQQLLVEFGANSTPLALLSDQQWRLVTQGFLHIGVFHLLVNMLGLFLLGRICEGLFGSARFLIIYFMSDVGAAFFSDLIRLHSDALSAGASGPICGILGAYFVFVYTKRASFEPDYFKTMMRRFGEYALVIFVLGVLVHADHAAHLGGAVSGALFGLLLLKLGNFKIGNSPLLT
jgi:rhomboid protease GluP